ncbi:YkoP family protein [Gracilibacillus alcaliphilus]|uniref:YkoP family protein n=1 Tax=Gracilibacillus alcaliphilus TaxID=1401441 RepID=UPI00195A416C|nr:hypothetical protein [Gracilibacillus alcaliphilus]MBM7676038.1 hypothetical protein [Gracilibacillus alcaliphilus]
MRNYLLRVWNVVDPIYYACSRLHYVVENQADDNRTLFRVRMTTYQGREVKLQDGTIIRKHDLLLKIHLHNVRMLNDLQMINNETKRALYTYQKVKQALPRLAYYVKVHPKSSQIKGVVGITSLNKGANRLGFEAFPIENTYYRTYKKLSFLLIHFIANTKRKDPVYLFMSKDILINKYRSSI